MKEYPYKIGGGITSVVDRISDDVVRKTITMKGIGENYILTEIRRIELLNRICPLHFPKIINYSTELQYIDMEYCGEILYNSPIPHDYKNQIAIIAESLAQCSIWHNDLTSNNVLVKDGVLKVIDFADCKVSKQGIRPIEDFWSVGPSGKRKFLEGQHYSCSWLYQTVDAIHFILDDDIEYNEYVTISSLATAVRTKGWVSQRNQLIGLFDNLFNHRVKNGSEIS